MKALMAALLLTFTASSAFAVTTWQTGSSVAEQERGATPTEKAQNPHSWYGGDLYHGQR